MEKLYSSRPLVTFALFAYNQEKYIKDAINAAFAQTYQPLEIILSDDASKDSTFKIIQEMAAAYTGPHSVHINQSRSNLGLASHINEVSTLCRGEIVVVAAGDDISKPERCERLAQIFEQEPKVLAALSDFYVLGTVPEGTANNPRTEEVSNTEVFYNGGGIGAGATYAYRRELFSWPSPLPSTCLSEDRLLPARAALRGVIRTICEPLVGYRVHEQSMNAKLKQERKLAREDREHRESIFSLLNTAAQSGVITKSERRSYEMYFQYGVLIQSLKRKRGTVYSMFLRVIGRFLDRMAWRKLSKLRRSV